MKETIKRNSSIYVIIALFAAILGMAVWIFNQNRNPKKCQPQSGQIDATARKHGARSERRPKKTSKPSDADKLKNDGQHNVKTVKVPLTPAPNVSFMPRSKFPSADGKFWNENHDMYLVRSPVWYDLYNQNGKKIFRLPSYLNVNIDGSPDARETTERDIEWQWSGDFSIIGVQQIVDARKARKEGAKLKGFAREFAESSPDSVRIYMYDVRQLETLYELIPPAPPKGFIVRIESISSEGYISLAAIKPDLYNAGNDAKDHPELYQYLGIYQYGR